MLHLLSCPIDAPMAGAPLMNEAKRLLIQQSEDIQVTVIREWAAQHQGDDTDVMTGAEIADSINRQGVLRQPMTGKRLAPILLFLGHRPVVSHNQNLYKGFRLLSDCRSQQKGDIGGLPGDLVSANSPGY